MRHAVGFFLGLIAKKKICTQLIFLFGSLGGGDSFSEQKYSNTLLVVDSPVNVEHSLIRPIYDVETMKNIQVNSHDGTAVNLHDYHMTMAQAVSNELDDPKYEFHKQFLEGSGSSELSWIRTLGQIYYLLSPLARRELNHLLLFYHGTHVAGIIGQSVHPEKIKLLIYPLFNSVTGGSYSWADLLNWERTCQRELDHHRQQFLQVHQVIQQGNVGVVNLSIGCDSQSALKKFSEKHVSTVLKILRAREIQKFSEIYSQFSQQEFKALAEAHPNTVFVIAAGNDALNLDQSSERYHWSQVRLKNVLVVGSMNREGKLSHFSNRGVNTVKLVALGDSVLSASVQGGMVELSGTSMAVPFVAQRAAEIRDEYPELTSDEAIQRLIQQESLQSPQLKDVIQEGRYLPGESF